MKSLIFLAVIVTMLLLKQFHVFVFYAEIRYKN